MTLFEFGIAQQLAIRLTATKLLKMYDVHGDAAWALIDEMIPRVIAENPLLRGVSRSDIQSEIASQVLTCSMH